MGGCSERELDLKSWPSSNPSPPPPDVALDSPNDHRRMTPRPALPRLTLFTGGLECSLCTTAKEQLEIVRQRVSLSCDLPVEMVEPRVSSSRADRLLLPLVSGPRLCVDQVPFDLNLFNIRKIEDEEAFSAKERKKWRRMYHYDIPVSPDELTHPREPPMGPSAPSAWPPSDRCPFRLSTVQGSAHGRSGTDHEASDRRGGPREAPPSMEARPGGPGPAGATLSLGPSTPL